MATYDASKKIHTVENQTGNTAITVEVSSPDQKVYITNVTGSVVTVTGKALSVSVENTKDSGVIFDDVIAAVEVFGSSKVQLQANGALPSLVMDKVTGASVYFQTPGGLDAEIVTSLCSEINLIDCNVGEDEDPKETPLPSQFATKFVDGNWQTLPSSHV
eukprot:TRINITY_DN12231_c0_g1_i1.p1 TRINITY_DN12231_c0_g1~~TRINITY_DN12231_c0_g1_i1.p1  ORF type:complete len:176 (-),score=32.60 TRINITY_DN12231_c0_g1_i1:51-530(-)